MNKFLFFVILWFLKPLPCFSYENFFQGVAAEALGGYRSTWQGIWEVSGNQAGITGVEVPMVSVFYRQRFMLAELSDRSFAFVYPHRIAHVGLSYHVFGNSSYSENQLAVSTARKFGRNFSAGLRFVRYSTTTNPKFDQRVLYNLDAGIIASMSEKFSWGCYIHSLIPYHTSAGQITPLPAFMGLGASYAVHPCVSLMSEIQLSAISRYAWVWAIKIEPTKNLLLLSGLNISGSDTYNFSFGFSYDYKAYAFGLAVVQHNVLGITPSFQLTYKFNRSK